MGMMAWVLATKDISSRVTCRPMTTGPSLCQLIKLLDKWLLNMRLSHHTSFQDSLAGGWACMY